MKTFFACAGAVISFLVVLSTSVAFAAGFVFHQTSGSEILFPILTLLAAVVLFFCVRWGLRMESLAVGIVLVVMGLFSLYGGFNCLIKLSASYTYSSDAYLISIAQERAAALGVTLRVVDGKVSAPPTLVEDYRVMMLVNLSVSAAMTALAASTGVSIVRKNRQAKKAAGSLAATAGQ